MRKVRFSREKLFDVLKFVGFLIYPFFQVSWLCAVEMTFVFWINELFIPFCPGPENRFLLRRDMPLVTVEPEP